MNRFKKAQQLRSETGQTIESITDLKTAGITQKVEDTKLIASDTGTDEPVLSKQDQDNAMTAALVVPEKHISELSETSIYSQPIIQTKEPVIEPTENYHENETENVKPIDAPETISTHSIPDTIPQTVSVSDSIDSQPVMPSYAMTDFNSIPQAVAIPPYNEFQPSQETTSIKHSKNSKKSVPNIFAPKSEAKSMRKSLVLKPTSVKIAENYCEKNGGSFNELIQTLLDNFIDEYGL